STIRSAVVGLGARAARSLVAHGSSTRRRDPAVSSLSASERDRSGTLERPGSACYFRRKPYQPPRRTNDLHGAAASMASASCTCDDEGSLPRILRTARPISERNCPRRVFVLPRMFDLQCLSSP